MKIMFVSVFSNHLFNWIHQLKDSGHELYWFDINDSNTFVRKIEFVNQIVKWRTKIDYPGRYLIKKNFPKLHNLICRTNDRNFLKTFEKKMELVRPDVVHSFEMHSACIPIVGIMRRNPQIKWIYTSWGSDMFYYLNDPKKLLNMKNTCRNFDYMFSDCFRDYSIARQIGFKGKFLGRFPGSGGFDIARFEKLKVSENKENILVIKGYEDKYGRCVNVLKALLPLKDELKDYRICVFAGNDKVLGWTKKIDNLEIKGRVGRHEVLKLMKSAIIYIGNSVSDGIPFT